MLIFADDLEALGADINGRRGIVCAYVLLSCFGFPIKWSKQRGGMKVEWIGLFADYTSMKLGLSPKPSSWLSEWVLKVARSGKITAKETWNKGLVDLVLQRMLSHGSGHSWDRYTLGLQR